MKSTSKKTEPDPSFFKRDKTQHIAALNHLPKHANLIFQSLFEGCQEGILVVDGETGEVLIANPFFFSMTGCPRKDVLHKKLWEIAPLNKIISKQEEFSNLSSQKFIHQDKLTIQTMDGSTLDVEFLSHLFAVLGKKVLCCNVRDISERIRADQRSDFIRNHDPLTNLYNRGYFEEELHRLEKSRQYPISIFMLDVDNLKQINDRQGHLAGDETLRQTAQLLKASFREEDILARIGGDEFAVLLPNTHAQIAEGMRYRICSTLDHNNQTHANLPFSLSLGFATSEEPCSLFHLLKEADERMYQHKRRKTSDIIA